MASLLKRPKITVRPRWNVTASTLGQSRRAVLVHPDYGTLPLKWWPTDIERGAMGRVYTEFERPGRDPLLLSTGGQLDTYDVGFSVRENGDGLTVAQWLDVLRDMAGSPKPVTLVMAATVRGLFHITALTITELEHTDAGRPSAADVSMTLTRASDYTVKVGPVRKVGGTLDGMAIRKRG